MAGPAIGEPAPEFDLPGSGGHRYRLADFRPKPVILAFYPGDFTPVCTRQFCSYRDNEERLRALGVPLLGISRQSVESHERFIAKYDLSAPLLSDEDGRVGEAYGVKAGPLYRRAIFVIDGEGRVAYRHVTMIGLGFQGIEQLERAIANLPASSSTSER